MMESLFILSSTRHMGSLFAQSQPRLGPHRILINEHEVVENLRGGTTPAVVLVINEPSFERWQVLLSILRVRVIDLRSFNK